jgi:hypothetical protein
MTRELLESFNRSWPWTRGQEKITLFEQNLALGCVQTLAMISRQ